MEKHPNILVTGANGQIGTVLTRALRRKYGHDWVLATDIRKEITDHDHYEFLDILNPVRFREILGDYKITQIYHLAAILSANGEYNPEKTWNINFNGLMTILKAGMEFNLDRIFFPSTIAVFGDTTPKLNTAQDVPMLPTTVYGMSKVSGELWCNYIFNRYGFDVRSIRYPGIIGHDSLAGGGTTDYAVEIFPAAIKGEKYTCFLNKDTRLPMMYMDDAIRATIELMEVPKKKISVRTSYNLAAMSFTPEELGEEIKKHFPEFKINYKPDFRQDIAASWSESIDDSLARKDWGWKPEFDLAAMTKDMIEKLS
jgi:nucleoside-diphosphate-sugar epimerase